jgi:hypothetical protein
MVPVRWRHESGRPSSTVYDVRVLGAGPKHGEACTPFIPKLAPPRELCSRGPRQVKALGDAVVDDAQGVVLAEQEIGGLDVKVDDTALV